LQTVEQQAATFDVGVVHRFGKLMAAKAYAYLLIGAPTWFHPLAHQMPSIGRDRNSVDC